MGFSLTCAICSPIVSNVPVPDVTFWLMDEILECGYINRGVQAVIEDGRNIEIQHYHAHDIAGTAFISLLLKRFPALCRERPMVVKAPAFYFKRDVVTLKNVRYFSEHGFQFDHPWEDLPPQSQRIVPQDMMYMKWPNLFTQFEHNQNLDRVSERRWPLLDQDPMSWIPCDVVAAWLDEFWLLNSTSLLRLEENWRAKSRLEGWHAQLRAYAKHGANLLVVSSPYLSR